MSRNLKKEYLKKLIGIVTLNGYKCDIANYISNPDYSHEYPNFVKLVSDVDGIKTYRAVRYFKYFGGGGDYEEEFYDISDADAKAGGWAICHNVRTNKLEASPRFSLNKLLSFC